MIFLQGGVYSSSPISGPFVIPGEVKIVIYYPDVEGVTWKVETTGVGFGHWKQKWTVLDFC